MLRWVAQAASAHLPATRRTSWTITAWSSASTCPRGGSHRA